MRQLEQNEAMRISAVIMILSGFVIAMVPWFTGTYGGGVLVNQILMWSDLIIGPVLISVGVWTYAANMKK